MKIDTIIFEELNVKMAWFMLYVVEEALCVCSVSSKICWCKPGNVWCLTDLSKTHLYYNNLIIDSERTNMLKAHSSLPFKI